MKIGSDYIELNHYHYLERFTNGVGLMYMVFAIFMLVNYILREFVLTVVIRILIVIWEILTCGG